MKKITFTGSTEVGKLLMEQAAKTMKRSRWSWAATLPSSSSTTLTSIGAVEGAMIAKFRNAGQTCVPALIASSCKTESMTPLPSGSRRHQPNENRQRS